MPRPKLEPWILGAALLLPTVVTLAYFWLSAASAPAVQQLVYTIGKIVQFALPVVWVFGVLRSRPRFSLGTGRYLACGALFGLAVMVATWLLYVGLDGTTLLYQAVERMTAKVQDLGVGSRGKFLALGVFYSLGHSFLEEYYWRWFVYGRLRAWTTNPFAIVLSAVGFTLHHVLLMITFFPHAPLVAAGLSACVLVGGLFWGWLYGRSGSLAGPWLGHLLVDAGIFTVGFAMLFG